MKGDGRTWSPDAAGTYAEEPEPPPTEAPPAAAAAAPPPAAVPAAPAAEPAATSAPPPAAAPAPPRAAAAPTGAPSAPPTRYDLGDVLGVGGMGEVYAAHDRVLHRDVAIKRLRLPGAGAAARFRAEAQVTAQLDHPNIVPVIDLGEDDAGRPYLAMKRVRGQALDARLRDAAAAGAPLSLEARLDVFRKVCDAIAFAHARGVLHRDIKPENVMVGAFGEVLVMDWGLARPIGATGAAPTTNEALQVDRFGDPARRTRDGAIAGTPAFMAPEQAEGRLDALDARTDVYGLGALLYALLTDRAPFSGPPDAILAAVRAGRFAPPASVARVPRELDAVVRKAMALAQADRYPSAEALREDIDAFLARQPLRHVRSTLPERVGKWVARHRTAVRAVAAVGAVAAAGLVYGLVRYAADVGAARDRAVGEAARAATAERAARVQLVAARLALADSLAEQGDPTAAGAALREARALATDLDTDRRPLEWALSAHARQSPPPVVTCTPHAGTTITAMALSSDGRRAVSVDIEGALRTWSVVDCAPIAELAVGPARRAALALDARGPRGALLGVDAARPLLAGVAGPEVPLPDARIHRVHVDGDAVWLAAAGATWRLDLSTGALTSLAEQPRERTVAWPAGPLVLGASVPDGTGVGGAFDRLGRARHAAGSVLDAATDPAGRSLALASAFGHEVRDLGTGRLLWERKDRATNAVSIPGDGTRLVATRFDGSVDVDRLADGAPIARLESGGRGAVAVSDDGRVVALAQPDGSVRVHVVPAQAPLALPVRFPSGAHAVAVSPDGRTLALGSDDGEALLLERATGATLQRHAGLPGGVRHLAYATDGTRIAFGVRSGHVGILDVASGALAWWEVGGRAPAVAWTDATTLGVVSTHGAAWRLEPEGAGLVALGPVMAGSNWAATAIPGTSLVAVDGHGATPVESVVFDVRDGRVVARWTGDTPRYRVAASPDGRTLVSGTQNGTIEVWDAATGVLRGRHPVDGGPTMGVAFSPDGQLLASTGFDGELDLWDTTTWTLLRSVPVHEGPGTNVAFTPDGAALVSTGGLGAVYFPLDAHTRHAAATDALRGPIAGHAAALAELGWWEAVVPTLDAAMAAGAPDDAALRAAALRALSR